MKGKIPLKEDIIYGPVNSRRLGKSLGINLTPLGRKICSLDCIYCQYGETEEKTILYDLGEVATPDEVVEALGERMEKLDGEGNLPGYVTFSGNGEPTLHPEYPKIVEKVKKFLDGDYPDTLLAVLSNASKIRDDDVRESMQYIDVPIMKLDVGSPEMFKKVNRPPEEIKYEEIVDGLCDLSKFHNNLYLQSLKFCIHPEKAKKYPGKMKEVLAGIGPEGNSGKDVDRWEDVVAGIKPKGTQIYTVDRPTIYGLEETDRERLEEMQERLEKRGVKAKVY